MKFLTLVLTVIFTISTFAGLESKIQSTVDGVTIPNTHSLDGYGAIYRGMAPGKRIQQLIDLGITDILIFKNQTRNEVDKEIEALQEHGYTKSQIHHIPFKWKHLNITEACEQTISALKLLREVYDSGNRSLFFHCTVGEDRTGLLAGVWELLRTNHSQEEVFKDQMCLRGYSAGNHHKPWKVVSEIRKGLSPLFVKLAAKIKSGELTLQNLDQNVCKKLPWIKKIPKC